MSSSNDNLLSEDERLDIECVPSNLDSNSLRSFYEEISSLKSALSLAKSQLETEKNNVRLLQEEKQNEEENRKKIELKLVKIQEDRERQTAALNETTRELQAALSDRENLMEQEDRIRAMIEDAEKIVRICESVESEGGNDDEVIDNKDSFAEESTIGSEFLVIFKAKLKELKGKLEKSNKELKNMEEENANLRDDLKAAQDSAESLPILQSKLARSHSLTQEKEEQCLSLQAQLSRAEQTVQEVKTEILSLQDKLIEEQDTATKHSQIADELRRVCAEQSTLIETFKEREEELLSELTLVKNKLTEAEKEKKTISEELRKLEEKRAENESFIHQQRIKNQNLKEIVEEEKDKFEQLLLSNKQAETNDFAETLTEEADDFEDAVTSEEESSGPRMMCKIFLPGLVVAFVAVFYFSLFTHEPSLPPPM